MKRYARLLQGLSMGFPIPGSSFENNQRLFTLSTNQFLKSHNALYHTASMFQDKTYKPQFQVRYRYDCSSCFMDTSTVGNSMGALMYRYIIVVPTSGSTMHGIESLSSCF